MFRGDGQPGKRNREKSQRTFQNMGKGGPSCYKAAPGERTSEAPSREEQAAPSASSGHRQKEHILFGANLRQKGQTPT